MRRWLARTGDGGDVKAMTQIVWKVLVLRLVMKKSGTRGGNIVQDIVKEIDTNGTKGIASETGVSKAQPGRTFNIKLLIERNTRCRF